MFYEEFVCSDEFRSPQHAARPRPAESQPFAAHPALMPSPHPAPPLIHSFMSITSSSMITCGRRSLQLAVSSPVGVKVTSVSDFAGFVILGLFTFNNDNKDVHTCHSARKNMQASDAKLWNSDKIVTQDTNKGGKDEI